MIPIDITPEQLQIGSKNTMVDHLGIEFLEVSPKLIKAKMPVDSRTVQPFRILHGGASVALAETLGSIAAQMNIDQKNFMVVGLDINANHIRSVREGFVYGVTKPIHIGRSTHVWEINITNEEDKLVCVSRLTVSVIAKK
ncbi:1,4-dihydroxy-2-naphthoyl-CoA hydrolase in menaquinone biosynthesis [hydrothermal vent metagenome]|uniref:1,4-dihydroxy-2-naphthoyl-CoA hydrolase in menaquinone biosynthesis n=1 Tax=hydrothermal vent metagenome TaxID=652676 RepID=A0A3B0UEW5_9ZZZZ